VYFSGDIKLIGIDDVTEPFAPIKDLLQSEDVVYGNLEGTLYDQIDPYEHFAKLSWRPAGTKGAAALKEGNFSAVGLANNVIIGDQAIRSTIDVLDDLGIAYTGAGLDLAHARAPAIIERNGVRYGFLQRTSIFWHAYHRAVPKGDYLPREGEVHGHITGPHHFYGAAGVATIRPRTAYEPSFASSYEAGGAALIHTWPDPGDLEDFIADIKALRPKVDILVTSNHWRVTTGHDVYGGRAGLARDFRVEIAHAAIDAGADIVASHGTHLMEEIEVYKGKAIFYGLGELYFGLHPDDAVPPLPSGKHRVKLLARAEVKDKSISRVSCRLILPGGHHPSAREQGAGRITLRRPSEEPEALEHLLAMSEKLGTSLAVGDDEITVVEATV